MLRQYAVYILELQRNATASAWSCWCCCWLNTVVSDNENMRVGGDDADTDADECSMSWYEADIQAAMNN